MKKSNCIEFYFDCSSPWTYLAFIEILPLSQRQNVEIIWKPILVGGVFNNVNQDVYEFRKNPNPLKLKYSASDLNLWAKAREINIFQPDIFPVNAVKAMRGCLFAIQRERLPEHALNIFRSYWQEGLDISNIDILLKIAALSNFKILDYENYIQSDYAKFLLKQNTDELISRGGFGSPTFFYRDHMFFGNDRIALLEDLLIKKVL